MPGLHYHSCLLKIHTALTLLSHVLEQYRDSCLIPNDSILYLFTLQSSFVRLLIYVCMSKQF